MAVNPRYKDSVFSLLFSHPDTLRKLYGAIKGVNLPPDIPLTINTLEGVLFRTKLNDISFEIGGKLVVLIEHQSTINPNMPLRLLMYIARIYEKITGPQKIYGSRKRLIPRPEFIRMHWFNTPPDLRSAFCSGLNPVKTLFQKGIKPVHIPYENNNRRAICGC